MKASNIPVCLVTSASKKNVLEILTEFLEEKLFDLIISREDDKNSKPNLEGFLKAISFVHVEPENTVIY